jgi:hypothetical protein
MKKFELHVIGQARGNPIYIIFLGVPPFWLKEELMGGPIGEFNDLVFDRGTISRARSFYTTGIKRRSMKVIPNNFMRLLQRECKPTGHLFHVELALAGAVQGEYLPRALAPDFIIIVKCESRRRLVA